MADLQVDRPQALRHGVRVRPLREEVVAWGMGVHMRGMVYMDAQRAILAAMVALVIAVLVVDAVLIASVIS